MMRREQSSKSTMLSNQDLFLQACRRIPGGVNSPVRAFGSVGCTPRFLTQGQGARVWDAEGKEYIDYVGAWGASILGHAHPAVVEAVERTARQGLSLGAPTVAETELAELLCELLPSMEQVRLVSSGTEATMSAIRLARGFTGRNRLLKFEGCYHGHADHLLVKAGSGLAHLSIQSSAGVPPSVVSETAVLPYNEVDALEHLFATEGHKFAAVIIEPIAGNMNLIQPSPAFISALRRLTERAGTLLIYDEVMTGFRVSLKGAQGLQGIQPDLTCLGKVIGGGLPLAAFGGRAEIMKKLAPLGSVYQAGTLSGNPVAVAAGLATLYQIRQPGFFEGLSHKTQQLATGLCQIGQEKNIDLCAQSIGGLLGFYFSKCVPQSYPDVMNSHLDRFKVFFQTMLEEGIYFAPSPFEANFVSDAHTLEDIQTTLEKIRSALHTGLFDC